MKHLMKKTKSKNMYELSKQVAYKKSEWHEKRAAISSSESEYYDDYNKKQTHVTSSIKANTSNSIFTKIKNKIKTETNKRGGDQKQKQKAEQILNNKLKLNLNAQTKLRNNRNENSSRSRNRQRHPIRSKIKEISRSSRRRTAENKPYFYYESDSSEAVPQHPSGFIKQAELYQATKEKPVQTETETERVSVLALAKQETQVFSTASKNFLRDIFDGAIIFKKKLKKRSASMPQIQLNIYTLDGGINSSVCHPNLKNRWASDSHLTKKISNTTPIPVHAINLISPKLYKLKTLAGQNLSSFLEKQGAALLEAEIKEESEFGAGTGTGSGSGTQHYDQDKVWIWKKKDETATAHTQQNDVDFNFRFPFREMNQTKRRTKAKKKKRRSKTRLGIKVEDNVEKYRFHEIKQQNSTGMDVYEYFNDFTRTELKTIGKTLYEKYGQNKKGRRRDLRIDFNPDIDPDADFKQAMVKRQSSRHVGFDVDLGADAGVVVKKRDSKIAASIYKNADKSSPNTKHAGAEEYEKILDRISLEMQLPYLDKHGNAITPAFEVSRNEDYRQVLTLVASEKNIHIQNKILKKRKLKQGPKFEAGQKAEGKGKEVEPPLSVGETLLTETAITIDKKCIAAHEVANSTRATLVGTRKLLLDPEEHCRVKKFETTNLSGASESLNPATRSQAQAPAQSAFSLGDAVNVITTDDTELISISVVPVPVPVEVETQVSAVSTVADSSDGSVFLTEVTSHTDSAATDREGAPKNTYAGHTQAQAQAQVQSQSQQPIGNRNDLVNVNHVDLEKEVGNELLSEPLSSPNSAPAHVHYDYRTETNAIKKMGSDSDAISLTPSQNTEIIEATSSISGAFQDYLSSNTKAGENTENRLKYDHQSKSKSQKSTLPSPDCLLGRKLEPGQNSEPHHVSYEATMPTSMPGSVDTHAKQKSNADAATGFNNGKNQENEDFTVTTSGSESVKLGHINIRPESIRKMLRLQAEILSEPDKYNDPKRFDAFDLVELDYAGMEAYLKFLVFSSLRRDELERLAQKQKLRDQQDLESRTTTSNLKDTDKDSLSELKDKYKGDNAYVSNSEYYDDDQTSLGFGASSKSFWTRVKMFFNGKLNPVTFCWKQKSVMSPNRNRGQRQVKPMTAAENKNKRRGQGSSRKEDSKHEGTDSDEETSSDDDTSTTHGTYRRRKELQSQIEGRDITDSDSDSDSDESDYTKTNDTKTKDTSTGLTDLSSSAASASTSQLRSTSKSKSKSKILCTDEDRAHSKLIKADDTGTSAVDDPTPNASTESKTLPEQHVI